MKLTKLALIATAMCTCLSLPLAAADHNAADEEVQSILKDLLHEMKLLRAKVTELEARLARMEATRAKEPATRDGLRVIRTPDLDRVFELEPRRSRLPLNGDKGLYIFPGIDAPPLTPMDALRGR